MCHLHYTPYASWRRPASTRRCRSRATGDGA